MTPKAFHQFLSAHSEADMTEGMEDYSRLDDVSPEHKQDIVGQVKAWVKALGKTPGPVEIRELAKKLLISVQDVAGLVRRFSSAAPVRA